MNLAKVVKIHPETNTVDLLILEDNRRLPGVRVMSPEASSGTGLSGLVMPNSQDAADPYAVPFDSNRDTIACVTYYRGVPIVLGFLYPTVTQVLFADLNRYMHRTASDFYHTVDSKGNAEWFHPSGAFITMATAPEHEDLTSKDFQNKWKIEKNIDKKIHIHIEQANGVASVNIAPDGTMVLHTKVTALLKADSGATIEAPTVTIRSPETEITGHLTVGNGVTVTGDVTADGVSLKSHVHTGVTPGGSMTGKPK